MWFRTWVGWDAQMALCARERRLHDLLVTMPLLAPIKCCEHPNSTLFLGILTSVGASTIILTLMTRSASLRQFNKWNRSRETTMTATTTTTAFNSWPSITLTTKVLSHLCKTIPCSLPYLRTPFHLPGKDRPTQMDRRIGGSADSVLWERGDSAAGSFDWGPRGSVCMCVCDCSHTRESILCTCVNGTSPDANC